MKNDLSRRPNSDQGVATELAWHSFLFLQSSCWGSSAHFHCAYTTLTMHALHLHGIHTAFTAFALCWRCVEDAMTSQGMRYSLCANATDDHSICTTTLMQVYGAGGTVPLCCFWDACDFTVPTLVFFIFLWRCGIAVRTLLSCNRGSPDYDKKTRLIIENIQ